MYEGPKWGPSNPNWWAVHIQNLSETFHKFEGGGGSVPLSMSDLARGSDPDNLYPKEYRPRDPDGGPE